MEQASGTDIGAIVGRDAELARFAGFRDIPASRLVTVSAGAGQGKTTFLAAAELLLRARDWTAARSDAKGVLTVSPRTTEESFVARIREVLALGLERDHDRLTPPAGALPRPGAGARAGVVPLPRAEELLFHDLRWLGRVAILVDDFRPTDAFRTWFLEGFLGAMRGSSVVTLLVVAGLPDAIEGIAGEADDAVVLGPLERAAVRAHFTEIGRGLAPPLTGTEIEEYVAECVERPAILTALTRLLTLLTPQARMRPSPAPWRGSAA
jgi:hypothetical protein